MTGYIHISRLCIFSLFFVFLFHWVFFCRCKPKTFFLRFKVQIEIVNNSHCRDPSLNLHFAPYSPSQSRWIVLLLKNQSSKWGKSSRHKPVLCYTVNMRHRHAQLYMHMPCTSGTVDVIDLIKWSKSLLYILSHVRSFHLNTISPRGNI